MSKSRVNTVTVDLQDYLDLVEFRDKTLEAEAQGGIIVIREFFDLSPTRRYMTKDEVVKEMAEEMTDLRKHLQEKSKRISDIQNRLLEKSDQIVLIQTERNAHLNRYEVITQSFWWKVFGRFVNQSK
jgi:SAM-dependent MidA family methyltransferase